MQSFETYLTTEAGLAPLTIKAYLYDIKEFLGFVNNKPLTASLINDFIVTLNHQNSTLKRKQMSIRTYCHYLISNNLIQPEILDQINPIKTTEKDLEITEEGEINQLLSATESPRDRAIILLLWRSALRASELCNLSVDSVSFEARMIRVKGKGSVDRMVPTTREAIEAIKKYLNGRTTGIMFPLQRTSVTNMITRTAHRAGIKHMTAHTLRHACATNLLNRNMPIDLIQSLLGHTNLSTTQRYLTVSHQRLKKVHSDCHPKL